MSTRNKSSEFKKGIKAFIEHVESLERSDDGFINEYVMIQEAQMRDHRDSFGSMEIGKLEPNLKKNRYKDIVPYDECRIVLSHSEGDDCSDYINASKITGVNGTAGYIASQGPLSWTVDDFWRMIWEYDVEIVFMACKLVEMKKIKCSQYWGDVGTSVEFGNITVFTVSEQEVFAECIQRTFRVTNGNEVHHVTQLHHYGWPDHGIPENPDDIRDVIGLMRSSRQNCKAPVLVHCSAGCGRTGTIIAIDYVWTLLENGNFDESFSLYDLICNFRKQRVSLVQTPDQYALVNKVLRSLCEEMLTKIASHTYENVQFNQEQSNNEGSQQTEENVYEDIWSVDEDCQVKATPLSLTEQQTIIEERYLGRANNVKNILPPAEKKPDDALNLYANSDEIKGVLPLSEKNQGDILNLYANSDEVQHVLPAAEKVHSDTPNLYANSDEIHRQMEDDRASQDMQPPDVTNKKPVHTTLIYLGSTNGAAERQAKTFESQITAGSSFKSASGNCGNLQGGNSEAVASSHRSEVGVTVPPPSPSSPSKESVSNSFVEETMKPKRESFILPQDFVTHL